jgi:hypothetical protein
MKVSISRVKLFKACRKAYEFKYVYNLVPKQKPEALEIGLGYHAKLEELYKTGDFDADFSKESAMATAYKKYIYPRFQVKAVEDWLEMPLERGNTLIGRVDGMADNGWIVEHKTTGQEIGPEYEYNLLWDEQILAYMALTGARSIYYTVCRKPSIRRKREESEEDFFNRMVDWYEDETEKKIALMGLARTDEEVESFIDDLNDVVTQMNLALFAGPQHMYRNTAYCHCWGRRCEYSPVCLNYNPLQEYLGFEKKEVEE